jgi:hypothetical protein
MTQLNNPKQRAAHVRLPTKTNASPIITHRLHSIWAGPITTRVAMNGGLMLRFHT